MSGYDVVMNGYRIGVQSPVFVEDIDLGTTDWRTQDKDRPNRDGRMMGRDYATPPTITLNLRARESATGAEARTELNRIGHAWRWTEGRQTPGAYATIAFEVEGVPRIMYGRPGKWSPNVSGTAFEHGGLAGTAEFVTISDLSFSQDVRTLDISILPNQTLGLLFPAESPFFFDGVQSQRQGTVTNGVVGVNEPSPFKVRFYGPVTNPSVKSDIGGWTIALETSIPTGQIIEVDTFDNTATRVSDGASFAHVVTHASDLAATLPVGAQEVTYSGIDGTNTSHVVVEWRETSTGF